jgi:hypothetical protein
MLTTNQYAIAMTIMAKTRRSGRIPCKSIFFSCPPEWTATFVYSSPPALSEHRFTSTKLQRKELLFHFQTRSLRLATTHRHRTSSLDGSHPTELRPRLGLQDLDPPSVQDIASYRRRRQGHRNHRCGRGWRGGSTRRKREDWGRENHHREECWDHRPEFRYHWSQGLELPLLALMSPDWGQKVVSMMRE